MKWLKGQIFLFSLLLFVYGAYFAFHQSSHKQIQVLGVQTNLVLFEEPQDGRQPILSAIDSAQKEIDMEIYLLSDKQIIQALIDAKNRGVLVKVMLEQHPFGGGNLNTKTQQTLIQGGVLTIWTNPSFALTHEKTIVIDNSEAFILNQNFTSSSFSKNREYDIIDTNPIDVAQIETIFNADWQRHSVTPTDANLVISPNTSRDQLSGLLTQSAKTIDIEMEIMDDAQMQSILSEKAKTEQIRVLIPDFKKVPTNRTTAQTLMQNGVQVKTISSPYLHAKLLLTDNRKAYIGSVNFSSSSIDDNRELGVIIAQQDILQTLSSDFETDWSKGTELSF